MGKWMDLAAQLEAACDTGDNRDNRDNSAANVPIVLNVPAKLPQDIRAGLLTLTTMAAPCLITPEAWPTAVSGALGLARDGWAEKALTLGWPALDLFGAVPDPAGDPEGDGLAVWLAGRKVLVLDEVCAVARDACGSRFYFHRPRAAGAVLMWTLGHGRR